MCREWAYIGMTYTHARLPQTVQSFEIHAGQKKDNKHVEKYQNGFIVKQAQENGST